MASRKLLVLVALLLTSVIGCQPAKNQSEPTAIGRSLRAGGAGNTSGGTLLGEVTSPNGDQYFDQEVAAFAAPTAAGTLGTVSSKSNQSTGVRFWGVAGSAQAPLQNNVQFDPSTLRIHFDIYDSSLGVTSFGISKYSKFYIGSGGYVQNGVAYLWWQDSYGTIVLSGYVNSQQFTGTVSYADSATGNSLRTLGNFVVPTCGFFVCNH